MISTSTPDWQLAVAVSMAASLLAIACDRSSTETTSDGDNVDTTASRQTDDTSAEETAREKARPPKSWVEERVTGAKSRLQKSEAGQIVWKSIEAHGGLKRWYRNGPLHFRYDYQPESDRPDHDTVQTVDTWSARARHHVSEKPDREYGWDGDRAWFRPTDWERPYDVRFWALTPYYFVGMPFVLADPGVNLEHEGTDTIEGNECEVIRATFGDVGISPDDYYVLYIDDDDHVLRALRYIVSYDPFFDEREHSPEKLMTYDGKQVVDGIRFAESYRFFMWSPDDKTDTEVVTNAELSQVEFRPDLPGDHFDAPDDARIHPDD